MLLLYISKIRIFNINPRPFEGAEYYYMKRGSFEAIEYLLSSPSKNQNILILSLPHSKGQNI